MIRKIPNSHFLFTLIRCISIFSFFLFPFSICNAQRSKDGAKLIIAANTIVNEYTALTANAATGTTAITVANSALNSNGRFSGNLVPGDLIMIIQIQGAAILGAPDVWTPAIGFPYDSTWGEITNYNNCGNWEFAEVFSVPNGTSITSDCPLKNNYTSAGKVVVVRIPRFSSLTINAGGSITCDPWDGTIGGVCAIEVENNTIINTGGSINITGKGFRGAQLLEKQTNWGPLGFSASTLPVDGAEKGEGIAGYETDYTPYGGMYCKGAPANGGGGGNAHNCGGGGGANGGNTLLWNGHGNPDLSVASYASAWNLQYPGFAAQTSSGGGQGGYSFSASDQNATATGPNNAAWNGDQRRPTGGYGGRPLDYSTGRLFLGGGGGAGDQNDPNTTGGDGGSGGGLIYLMNYGTVSGAGQIIANGNNGADATGPPQIFNNVIGKDGAGGAGAGGTIVVNSAGAISAVSIMANGGKGGNQIIVRGPLAPIVTEAEGPGGGGSGGYIAVSNGAPARTTDGGANGTTNSGGLTEFIPNGATMGGAGTNNASVTNFIINAANVTLCAGQSATLTATLNGTVPGGTTIIWYDNLVSGNTIGTGNTYSTIVLPVGTYTYYVGTCPGAYHQPVVVTVTSLGVVSAGNDVTICSGRNTSLNASGGTGYAWSPATGLNNPTISNPIAAPAVTTTYVVTVATPCGPENDTVIVTVNPSITASISGNTTICPGGNTTLTASGGGYYSWTTGGTTSSIIVAPTATTTYSVIAGNGSCTDTAIVIVTINNGVNATINGPTGICVGENATLNASGGSNYSWTTGETTSSITVAPTAATTYSVIAYAGNCADTASATVTVLPAPAPAITASDTLICAGDVATLTASGGGTYSWSNGSTLSTINVSPIASTTYSVVVSNSFCSSTASVTVIIIPKPTCPPFSNTTICSGQSATLSASGGTTYIWNNGDTGATINVSPNSTTGYCVTVYDANNCQDTFCVTVIVELCCEEGGTIYLPNAFSPNGDGENDILKIYYGNIHCIKTFDLIIYNRWGEKVLQSTGSGFQWDGMFKGKIEGTSVFVYYMEATLTNGEKITKKGNVSLIY